MPQPIHTLPTGYIEVEHLVVTDGRRLLWLNLLAVVPLLAALVLMALWWSLVMGVRGAVDGASLPVWAGLLLVLVILPLHEFIHAAAIRWAGYTPRIGAKLHKGVLYATADGALFRRDAFVVIAVAPLVVITLAGMGLMLMLPAALGYWAGLAVVLNAGSAIGDLWMVAAVRRYPADALVRDEEDGIRIYAISESR